ncbi:MAG: CBS domain-containing protein [Acidobacteriota bacterium]|jgi:CBS domain-containing protein
MSELKAKDVMTTRVVTVREDMTLSELGDVLIENEISGAPVVDEHGQLTGVVSVQDLVRQTAAEGNLAGEGGNPEFFVRGWEEQYSPDELRRLQVRKSDVTVRDVMTPAVFTVSEEDLIDDVAQTLVQAHIHRVLVTRDSVLVGIISSLDLLRAYLEEGVPTA